jgi:2-haloacid dehalogenase
MGRVCLFDVNETLLDLSALDSFFLEVTGDPGARTEWFSQLLQLALVRTVVGNYRPFGEIGGAALEALGAARGVGIGAAERRELGERMQRLPAHPEVRESLGRLRDAGLRLATLTNSTAEVGEAQLRHAGLRDLFEQALSADEAGALKPAAAPYRMAAERLGVSTEQVRLVAAHGWDVAGAQAAGCATAFVARPGRVLDPLTARPDVVGADLAAVADRLIELEAPG